MALGQDEEFDYLEEAKTKDSDEVLPAIEPIKKSESTEEPEEKPESTVKTIETKPEPEDKIDESGSQIYVVKVTTNKEDRALDLISDKVKKKNIDVYAIARPHGLRGYIFLEAPDRENAEEAVFNLPYVKGIIPQVISYSEIKSLVEPVASEIKIEKNDIVEIISEPFKKEKAKVVRIDKAKEEAIVSLLGAVVPIPVTVKLDNIRVIRREDDEELLEENP